MFLCGIQCFFYASYSIRNFPPVFISCYRNVSEILLSCPTSPMKHFIHSYIVGSVCLIVGSVCLIVVKGWKVIKERGRKRKQVDRTELAFLYSWVLTIAHFLGQWLTLIMLSLEIWGSSCCCICGVITGALIMTIVLANPSFCTVIWVLLYINYSPISLEKKALSVHM